MTSLDSLLWLQSLDTVHPACRAVQAQVSIDLFFCGVWADVQNFLYQQHRTPGGFTIWCKLTNKQWYIMRATIVKYSPKCYIFCKIVNACARLGGSHSLVMSKIERTLCLLVETGAKVYTVFARSDAAAIIYFITQFCAASIREWRLLNSVVSVKSFVYVRTLRIASYKINKELRSDLLLKQNFKLVDQPSLSYKAVRSYLHGMRHCHACHCSARARGTRPLHRRGRRQRWAGRKRTSSRRLLKLYLLYIHAACFDIVYCHYVESRGLFTCTCATRILATASIRERPLFRSAYPEVRRQFEKFKLMTISPSCLSASIALTVSSTDARSGDPELRVSSWLNGDVNGEPRSSISSEME